MVETVVWQPAKERRSRRRPQVLPENRDGRFRGGKRSHRFVSSAIIQWDGAEEFVTADGSDVIVVMIARVLESPNWESSRIYAPGGS